MPLISSKDIFLSLVEGFLTLWKMWLIIGAVIIIKIYFKLLEKQRLSNSGIAEIDRMDGLTFEKYLEALFEKLGYKVERTQYIGDYGADLITSKAGMKTVIQAKRYKRKVDIKAVQEAVAAKGKYGCTEAMVVTNSFFTKPAIELAKANNVILWDRNHLVKALLSIKKDTLSSEFLKEVAAAQKQQALKDIEQPSIDLNVCAVCGKPVSERVKQYCLSNQQRFKGKVFCFEHQREIKMYTSSK
ncbi:MAG: restriction endonuclease [Lutispora sp.]|nr:restriction endonuclease [Lutispora sp.]